MCIAIPGTLPHKYKIVIAGNHDLTFDPTWLSGQMNLDRFGLDADKIQKYMKERGLTHMKELLTNCTYLEDSSTTVYGITIYGSPWYVLVIMRQINNDNVDLFEHFK